MWELGSCENKPPLSLPAGPVDLVFLDMTKVFKHPL